MTKNTNKICFYYYDVDVSEKVCIWWHLIQFFRFLTPKPPKTRISSKIYKK